MKFMKTNRISLYICNIVILAALLMLIQGCKKDLETNDLISTDGKSKLVFSVQGLNNGVLQEGKLGSTVTVGNSNLATSNNSLLHLDNSVNIIAKSSLEVINSHLDTPNNSNKLKNKFASIASPLHNYTRYRLLLYDAVADTLVRSIETSADGVAEIEVTIGKSYKWYAYSYNTQDPVEEPMYEGNVPMIKTISGKEFIWDSSDEVITPSLIKHPISIIFAHKVAEVIVEIDSKDLFGKITDISIEFDNPNNFNTAKINLFTGAASDIENYSVQNLNLESFEYGNSSDSTILRAVFYTADPANLASGQSSGLNLKINKLTAEHHGGQTREIHKITDPPKLLSFNFTSPSIAKSHVASLNLRYTIPTKRILHVIEDLVSGQNDDRKYSFAAQPLSRDIISWTTHDTTSWTPPLNMLKAKLNFGNLPTSIVQTSGFTHERCLTGQLAQKLVASGKIPDIVIISVYYFLTANDITALKNYINNNGVVIMMTDSAVPWRIPSRRTEELNEVYSVQSFFRSFFEDNSIALNYANTTNLNKSYFQSMMFELDHERKINDKIINGPFGNLSGAYWGNDSYWVVEAEGLPIGDAQNQVTIYSNPQAINSANVPTGVSMFKHNSKSFFWIGDGSFLSHPNNQAKGWSLGWWAEPFATVGVNQANPIAGAPNHYNYPVPKRYGVDYDHPIFGNIGFSYGAEVYNAPLFANLMAWALYQSEFFGINKGKITENWQEEGKDESYIWK